MLMHNLTLCMYFCSTLQRYWAERIHKALGKGNTDHSVLVRAFGLLKYHQIAQMEAEYATKYSTNKLWLFLHFEKKDMERNY